MKEVMKMTKQEFVIEFETLIEKYENEGAFEKIKNLKDELGVKYNSYKRELDGISQEEFIEKSIEEKKQKLLKSIKK